jgi:hypothetical protein
MHRGAWQRELKTNYVEEAADPGQERASQIVLIREADRNSSLLIFGNYTLFTIDKQH